MLMALKLIFTRSARGLVGVLLASVVTPTIGTAQLNRAAGIRFSIAGPDSPSPAQGVLGVIGGIVEFAGGRGRLDVDSTAGRDVNVNGVVVTRPLAKPGDYYLFDSTGFVLVRPHNRTFSVFRFGRSWIHLGSARDSSEGFMEFVGLRADTLPLADASTIRQHGPFTVRWHVDRRRSDPPPIDVLSRGWIEVADAPAGEASAIRWFGAAAALATLSASPDSLQDSNLQVTAAVVLKTQPQQGPVNLIVLHPIGARAHAEINVSRLVIPPRFTETVWPGFELEMKVPRDDGLVAKWRRMPNAAGK
jgi:hypothetical protein